MGRRMSMTPLIKKIAAIFFRVHSSICGLCSTALIGMLVGLAEGLVIGRYGALIILSADLTKYAGATFSTSYGLTV